MIINPISKGGNGLLPEIIVTAPSGSTLDLMQGSVVLQTYTLSSTETQHTFTVKNTGTYTVRGTSGSDTASVEVVVDVVGRYSCTISYFNGLKLYWLGDECEDVTGGWEHTGTGSLTKNSDNLQIHWASSRSAAWTAKPFKIIGSTLYATSMQAGSGNEQNCSVGLYASDKATVIAYLRPNVGAYSTKSVSIPEEYIGAEAYVELMGDFYSSSYGDVYMKALWLE